MKKTIPTFKTDKEAEDFSAKNYNSREKARGGGDDHRSPLT
jgi:hypothetical protein